MEPTSILRSLSSRTIATLIRQARRRVVYAAPGIHGEPAAAVVELVASQPSLLITINLDYDEHTLRMGYGTLEAVEVLTKAGIAFTHYPGFRSGILIVDEQGWIFTPNALYLEAEPQSDKTPNAVELTTAQVKELTLRLSQAAQKEALEQAENPSEAKAIADITNELCVDSASPTHLANVKSAIETAPPVKFDLARQVRVFESYLQYVELSLTGAAVQRHRIRIPNELQNLGASKDLEGKLKTTFDLFEKGSSMSSKALEKELNEIRKNFTPSLGKDHGRVVLKSAKPHLTKRINRLRKKLEDHQKKLEAELQSKLDESKKQVVDYYLPLVVANPPDALLGGQLFSHMDEENIRPWIEDIISQKIPSAADLIHKMVLEERYKDVTFETLNRKDFLESVQQAFPYIDWEKAYKDFKAAGEERTKEDTDEF